MLSSREGFDDDISYSTTQSPDENGDSSLSSSNSSAGSSFLPTVTFSPTLFYQAPQPCNMENIWTDLGLGPLGDTTTSTTRVHDLSLSFNTLGRPVISNLDVNFSDLLGRPFSREPSTASCIMPAPNGTFTLFGSSIPVPPMPVLNFCSNGFHFYETPGSPILPPSSKVHANNPNRNVAPTPLNNAAPGGAFASHSPSPSSGASAAPRLIGAFAPRLPETSCSSLPEALGGLHRVPEPVNSKSREPVSSNRGKKPAIGDSDERQKKRMINNRESAARSRARKLAYTSELELKVKRLFEENHRLRQTTEELREAAEAQATARRRPFERSATAPL